MRATGRSFLSRARETFGILGAAYEAASAAESGRRPPARALRRLGIDPKAYPPQPRHGAVL